MHGRGASLNACDRSSLEPTANQAAHIAIRKMIHVCIYAHDESLRFSKPLAAAPHRHFAAALDGAGDVGALGCMAELFRPSAIVVVD